MQKSAYFMVSSAWRMHSELIQGWVAGLLSEPLHLQQARSYLYDLKLDEALEEVEDATELVYYMHRLSYPAGSHLEAKVKDFFVGCAGHVSWGHLLEIGRRLIEHPSSGLLWSRVVFEQPWFTKSIARLLGEATLEEHVTFCAAFWRSLFLTPQLRLSWQRTNGAVAGVSQQLALLTAQRIEQASDGHAICLCAQLGVPLQEESLVVLREVILSHTRSGALSTAQVLLVAEALLSYCFADAEWLDALQFAICRSSPCDVNVAHVVGFFRTVMVLQSASVSVAFEELLVNLLPEMSPDLILVCCSSISGILNVVPLLREKLRKRLLFETEHLEGESDCGDDILLWQLRGMALIAAEESTALLARFVERVKDTVTVFSVSATQSLVRCMHESNTFPPELVLRCKKSFLHNTSLCFSQKDSAYLLYAAARIGEPVDGVFFKEALSRFAAARNFNRRKNGANQNSVLPIETVIMVLEALDILKGGSSLHRESKVYAVLRDAIEQQQQQHKGVSVDNAISILKFLVNLKVDDTQLATSLLTLVSKSISCMTPVHVKSLCEVLVTLRSRDVLMFRALLSHLVQSSPSREAITSMASTARKLKFVSYFQRSVLVDHVTSLEGWDLSDILLVASVCNEKQRARFLALPGAELVSVARTEELTTFDLFLLFPIAGDNKEKVTAMAALLKSRSTLAAEELEVEDVWRAFVKAVDDKDALAAVCRCGAATMQTMDENMLMRFLEAVSVVPDIPNTFFRVVGKAVLRLVSSMAIENALRWLQLYVRYKIRDDSVGKALLARVRARSSHAASMVDRTIREASIMYGKSFTTQSKTKKHQEKVEWYSFRPA